MALSFAGWNPASCELHSHRASYRPEASDVATPRKLTISIRKPFASKSSSAKSRGDACITRFAEVPDALPFFGDDGQDDDEYYRSMLERVYHLDDLNAQAVCGPVECTSRGCRPLFSGDHSQDQSASQQPQCEACSGGLSDGCQCGSLRQLASAAASTSVPGDSCDFSDHRMNSNGLSSFPLEFAEFAEDVWRDQEVADKYYQTAVVRRPFDVDVLIKYAEFSWQKMRNKGQAESLFGKALEEEPENAAALASYALFLWESEASTEA